MTEFISEGKCWARLGKAAKTSTKPAYVAVAYFGKGASRLLPLPKRSRLVVDASESAVKSGQTCPAELKTLKIKKRVRIYSVENLHAKVFVLGPRAFVGSANVSRHSADTLLEAMVATTDRKVVRAARQFVKGKCLEELGPKELDRLQRMYRPPRAGGRGRVRRSRGDHSGRPALSRLMLTHLDEDNPPKGSESAIEAGKIASRKLMEEPRTNKIDEPFWCFDKCRYNPGDIVVQVVPEKGSRQMVSPPAKVLKIKAWEKGTEKCTFVFVEMPKRRWIRMERLAKRIGRGAQKNLRREGKVSRDFKERLLAAWGD